MSITEIPLDRFIPDTYSGYYYTFQKDHEMSAVNGHVYMHRYVMAKHVGRVLEPYEIVHHKDHNRANNEISNLEILTSSEHSKLHMLEKHGPPLFVDCSQCGLNFKCCKKRKIRSKSGKLFCSDSCFKKSLLVFEVEREVLQDLVWNMPTTQVAKLFGVSDKAIEKRCKSMGIEKPPRGFWQKRRATSCVTE